MTPTASRRRYELRRADHTDAVLASSINVSVISTARRDFVVPTRVVCVDILESEVDAAELVS